MKTKFIMIILLVIMMPIVGMAMGQVHRSGQIKKLHDVYYCPMHPQIIYDHPGNCPICGMNLIKKAAEAANQKPLCSCCGLKHK